MVQALLELSKNEKFWAQILKDLIVILNYLSSAVTGWRCQKGSHTIKAKSKGSQICQGNGQSSDGII